MRSRLAALLVSLLALPGAAFAADDSTVGSVASQIASPSACWSCQLYGVVYNGMHVLVQSTYASLVDSTLGAVAFGTTVLMIAVLVKVLPMLVGSEEPHRVMAHLRVFLFRVAVVFLLLVGSAATTAVASGGLLSDWLVDGPLAIGTALASDLSNASLQGLNSSASSGVPTNLFSGYDTALAAAGPTGDSASTNIATVNASNPGTSTSFGINHVLAAQGMLYHLHTLGAVGIVTGVWIAIANPQVSMWHPLNSAVIIAAGFFLAFTFFRFTVFFGLRYMDALIRSMLIFSLLPVFLFLWIFDSTRQIAIQALRAGLSLAAVFAVSGVVFTAAYFILFLAFQAVFTNQGMAFQGLSAVLQNIGQGQFAQLIGQSGTGDGSVNWLGYFYLVGAGSMATACADLAFKLAEQVFDFGSSSLNIAEGVKEDIGTIGGAAMSAGQTVLR